MAWAALGSGIDAAARARQAHADRRFEGNMAADEYQRQKEFAQMGIRWRVEDAKAAGLHPLAALGANTISYSPSQVGSHSAAAWGSPFEKMGAALDNMNKTETLEEKEVRRLKVDVVRAELRKAGIEGDIKELELQKMKNPSMPLTGPSPIEKRMGIAGQDDGGYMSGVVAGEGGAVYTPNEIPAKDQPGFEAGFQSMYGWYQYPDGSIKQMIGQKASEPVESNPAAAGEEMISNVYSRARGLWHGMGFSSQDSRGAYLKELEDMQPESKQEGWEWRYYPVNGRWYLCDMKGGGSRVVMSLNDEFYNWREQRKERVYGTK